VHASAVGERLARDPAEDFAALLVHAEPTRRGVEADTLEVEEDLAEELRIRPRRSADRVADANDGVVGRAAGEPSLPISRG
jgi:hypothetical protein